MNTNLAHHIEMRTPLIWVDSDEGYRVTETVIASAQDRFVYRMNGFDGLVRYDHKTTMWKRCLIPQGPENELKPCFNLQIAITHLHSGATVKGQSILVIDQAHGNAPENLMFLAELSREFSYVIDADNFDALELQCILVSGVDKVPPELVKDIVRLPFTLPDAHELHARLVHIATGAPGTVDTDDVASTVRAGQGLTDMEFTRACVESIRESGSVAPEYVNQVKVNIIKAGGVLEVRRPHFSADTVGGLDNAKALIQRIVWLFENEAEATAMHVLPAKRVLLVGIPGSGKSMLCEMAATELGLDLAISGVSKALSKWVGESEQNMRNAFRQVAAMAPIVMWIDEFGRDMSGSGVANDAGTTDRVHGEFLTGLQELPDNVFLFAAANRVDALPPEMLRADRFDKIMFVGFPTPTERAEILSIHLGEEAKELDMERLARATHMFTGAEIKALITSTRFDVVPVEHRPINTDDLETHAQAMKGRVWINHQDACKEMYERALQEWEWASSAQERAALNVLGRGVATRPNTPTTAPTANPFSTATAADIHAAAKEIDL